MKTRAFLLALVFCSPPSGVLASDHADPIGLAHLEAGITGLFAFPDGDDLVVVLTIRRALTSAPPYDLEDYEYTIYMDLNADLSFDDKEDLARYGGTVNNADAIEHEVAIRFRLNGKSVVVPQAGYPRYEGLTNASAIDVYTGVRDDPFIFPRFFGKNVIAMVLSIPFSSFPAGQRDWLIWGTSTRQDWLGRTKQIDHVGRSNRTQLGRFDFLNTLHPREHQAAIQKKYEQGEWLQERLTDLMGRVMSVGPVSGLFEYVIKLRRYDMHPDVMIFSTRFPPGFPNGRRLEDDVAGLTCAQGDCVLQEVALIEGSKQPKGPWPRRVTNDKTFLTQFPYLAEPHPEQDEKPKIDLVALIFWLAVLALLIAFIFIKRDRTKRAETPYVKPHRGRRATEVS